MGRTVIVTGASRSQGIGRACARAFLRAGYNVMAWDIDPWALPDPVMGAHASRVCLAKADVSSRRSIEAALQKGQQQFGEAVHVIINNAAIANPYLTEADREGQWNRVIAVQPHSTGVTASANDFGIDVWLQGHFWSAKWWAHIWWRGTRASFTSSSTRAHQSEPNSEAYAAAKAGLLGLTHAQATSLGPKVRVNAILPGWINTFQEPYEISSTDKDWHLVVLSEVYAPMAPARESAVRGIEAFGQAGLGGEWSEYTSGKEEGRLGKPDDVAQLALFLADGQKSGFITGQVSFQKRSPKSLEGLGNSKHIVIASHVSHASRSPRVTSPAGVPWFICSMPRWHCPMPCVILQSPMLCVVLEALSPLHATFQPVQPYARGFAASEYPLEVTLRVLLAGRGLQEFVLDGGVTKKMVYPE
eukprot:jgi/Botrbrau1/11561/Bobra.60_1s0014.1